MADVGLREVRAWRAEAIADAARLRRRRPLLGRYPPDDDVEGAVDRAAGLVR